MRSILPALLLLAAPFAAHPAFGQNQTYTLNATPETVVWGNYNAAAKPALTIKSGDTVVMPNPFHLRATFPPGDPRHSSR